MDRMTVFRVVENIVTLDVEPPNPVLAKMGVSLAGDDAIFGIEHTADEEMVQFDISPIPPTKRRVPYPTGKKLPGERDEIGYKITMDYAVRAVFAVKSITREKLAEMFGADAIKTAAEMTEEAGGEEDGRDDQGDN